MGFFCAVFCRFNPEKYQYTTKLFNREKTQRVQATSGCLREHYNQTIQVQTIQQINTKTAHQTKTKQKLNKRFK